jgi:HK97 family phage portal protein
MWPFTRSKRAVEERSSIEDPRIPLSSPGAFASLFGAWYSVAGVTVTRETALGVPSVWGAVNFLSGTIAALPVPVYQKTGDSGRQKADNNPVSILLHDWVNDDYLTSFQWRKQAMTNVLLDGRSLTFIEGKRAGRITNLWPFDPTQTRIERKDGRRQYVFRDTNGEKRYETDEVIDIPFLMGKDGINHVVPVERLRGAVGLALALEDYAQKFFLNGGVPPLALQMPGGSSGGAAARASANIEDVIRAAGQERKLVLPIPLGHRLDPIGFEPAKGQLVEARMMQLREVARIYGLPPVFLQDLEFGTFSNTEQQDLQLVKHTLMQWLRCWEGELNAKLFGPRSKFFVEFNVDGLLRGDFKTRMDGYATGVQNAIITPDEARDRENLPRKSGDADSLHIQGATVPLGQQKQAGNQAAPAAP